MNTPAVDGSGDAALRGRLAAKVQLRLALPCILFMLMSSLDRANISFAAVQMNAELGLTPGQYGFGAGILFVGFLLGQYPSLFLYQRLGMRRWLAVCALLWGGCALGMSAMSTPREFYALRVLLGLAEGGLAPGIVLYLGQFATARERAATFALPMLAIPLSVIIGGPLSGWLMGTDNPWGLAGWRWMFIVEALPTVLLGLAALAWFPDVPDAASWLGDDEKAWLEANAATRRGPRFPNDWTALRRSYVWLSALLWFCLLAGAYGVIFWLPQVVGSLTTFGPLGIGIVGAMPWIGVGLGMYFNARHSDRTGERFWHVGLPALVAALALLAAWSFGPGVAALLALFVAGLGLGASQGAFWALPASMLPPAALGIGVVAINIAGSSGGLVMPNLMGWARQASSGYAAPTMLVVGVLLLAAASVVALRLSRMSTGR